MDLCSVFVLPFKCEGNYYSLYIPFKYLLDIRHTLCARFCARKWPTVVRWMDVSPDPVQPMCESALYHCGQIPVKINLKEKVVFWLVGTEIQSILGQHHCFLCPWQVKNMAGRDVEESCSPHDNQETEGKELERKAGGPTSSRPWSRPISPHLPFYHLPIVPSNYDFINGSTQLMTLDFSWSNHLPEKCINCCEAFRHQFWGTP